MKIAFLHYNIGHRDGVNSVMRANAHSLLEKYKKCRIYFVGSSVRPLIEEHKDRVEQIDVPEMDILKKSKVEDYSKQEVYDYMKEGVDLFHKLDEILEDMDYVIFENPNIGVHPAVTYAYYRLVIKNAQRGIKRKLTYRMHDFAEDRRGNFINLMKFRGSESSPYWHKVIFPRAENLSFIVINKKDFTKLQSHGIIENNRPFYLPNPVNDRLYYDDKETSEKLRKKLIKKYSLNKYSKFLFYPVRIVPRKNVEEAIFLTQLLNIKFNENYVLVASLKPKGKADLEYFNTLKKFVKEHKLPVILGINDMVTLKRTYTKSKNIKTFGLGDMYNLCDKVISTSTLEGFGLFFIESWFFNKAIIGRDLPDITSDFKNKGINLEHLYNALFVDGSDFKDFGTLSKRLNLILKLDDSKFLQQLEDNNKQTFAGFYDPINTEDEEKLIKKNRKLVLDNYSTDVLAKELKKILDKTPSRLEFKK
ncbi:hypothetical protein GF336_03780 [Candidatus Woesearchaeota archaeon]|nr:hypothetical protein [Candidatus Woesearchaeota archaeon]